MTPERLRACLETIRWSPATLASSLEIDPRQVEDWISGETDISVNVASWIEALCFTHEASDLMRPVRSNGKSYVFVPKSRVEHVPEYSYGLLRRIHRGPVPLKTLFGTDDEGAVFFLVSRGLAERVDDMLKITQAGAALGEIAGPLQNQ